MGARAHLDQTVSEPLKTDLCRAHGSERTMLLRRGETEFSRRLGLEIH